MSLARNHAPPPTWRLEQNQQDVLMEEPCLKAKVAARLLDQNPPSAALLMPVQRPSLAGSEVSRHWSITINTPRLPELSVGPASITKDAPHLWLAVKQWTHVNGRE